MKKNHTQVTEFILLGFSVPPELQIAFFILFLLMYILTLIGNLLIMSVVYSDRSLHVPMYIFLFALSCSETCYSLVIVPKMLVDLLAKVRTISFTGCAAQMFLFLGLGATNCLILTFMGYDRYLAICHPLRYPLLMNMRVIVWLIVISWIAGFLISLSEAAQILRLPFCGPNAIRHFFCHMRAVVRLACTADNTTEVSISTIGMLGLAGSLLFIMLTYILILSTILRIPSTEGRQKAFSTCAAHLIVVSVHYTFASIIYFKWSTADTLEDDTLISIPYTIITPFLSPIIFTLRNKEIKVAVRKVITKKVLSQKI
ncbi:olfactory receptor 10X1-like [Lacerta agilis]|uniref:olfactory receptor 10X1-like n=1 Tax=Lacerta agilis TaxID=80427 RepID=UPI00141930B8|nr:olfactory receptor 10X1-like [Lacerta agilis]